MSPGRPVRNPIPTRFLAPVDCSKILILVDTLFASLSESIECLQRTRLSRRRMICLLSLPFPPLSCQQVASLFLSSYVSPVELTEGRGRWVVWEELNQTIARKPGPLKTIQYSLI